MRFFSRLWILLTSVKKPPTLLCIKDMEYWVAQNTWMFFDQDILR